jgi:hypothetical protein
VVGAAAQHDEKILSLGNAARGRLSPDGLSGEVKMARSRPPSEILQVVRQMS